MAIINVHLDGELEKFVYAFVKAGYAGSKAEVIRAALREYEQRNKIKIVNKEPIKILRDENLKLVEERLKKEWDNDTEEKFWSKYY